MYEQAGAMKAVAISLSLIAFTIAVLFSRTTAAKVSDSYVAQGGRAATWTVAGFLWLLAAPQPGPPAARAAQDQPANKDRPNVLFIVLDTVRADHLSLYGYSRRTSPSLEAFAEQATTFSFAHSTAPFTLSSHASMFTGQLPSEHGAHHVPLAAKDGDFRLAAGTETLASRLADKGYRTGAVVANTGYLGPWTGLAQGFHEYKSRPLRQYGYVPAYLSVLHRVSKIDADALLLKSADARFVTNQAMAWIEEHRERPFFLFVNYFDAHDPYRPPARYARRYLESPASSGGGVGGWPASQYDGEIAFLDAELGRLFQWLDETKIAGRTLVIVTSDHGEGFGEHGCHGHSNSLYEELPHVPLVVRLPGQNKKSQSDAAVSLRSIPTIVDMALAGERDPDALSTRLAASESRLIAEHWFSTGNANNCASSSHGPVIRAVFNNRRKLIQTASVEELYDLAEDPGERRDLFRAAPELAQATRRSVLLPQIPELGLIVNSQQGTKPARPDEVTWERLRALGYVK
jgi:arylsulfatase A-like enzyme